MSHFTFNSLHKCSSGPQVTSQDPSVWTNPTGQMRWKRQRGTEVEVSYIREGEDNISFLNCFERPVPERTWISLSEGLLPALLRMRGRENDCRGDRKRERRGGGLGGGWQVTCLSLTPVWTLHHLTLNQNCCRWRAGSYLPCIIRHNLHRCSLHHSGSFRARIQGPCSPGAEVTRGCIQNGVQQKHHAHSDWKVTCPYKIFSQ